MTREEYLKRSEQITGGYCYGNIPFPRILQSMAEYFFTFGDEKDKELADETRRRLIQINETGATDD